jgi:hypothetical protein
MYAQEKQIKRRRQHHYPVERMQKPGIIIMLNAGEDMEQRNSHSLEEE